MGSNTYYKGDDGEWYAKVIANPGDYGSTYSDNSEVTEGNTVYFRVEPIKWKVLTTDYNGTEKALLFAEEILTANVSYYHGSTGRTINDKYVFQNNYMYSTIRAYLNGKYESDDIQPATYNNAGFLQTAFTESARALIADTEVVNDGASTSDATGTLPKADGTDSRYPVVCTCTDTTDKIFLLSVQEVTTTDYGFSVYCEYGEKNTRIREATDYAKANFLIPCEWWMLRTPAYGCSDAIYCVDNVGSFYSNGDVTISHFGIIPALTISLK